MERKSWKRYDKIGHPLIPSPSSMLNKYYETSFLVEKCYIVKLYGLKGLLEENAKGEAAIETEIKL